MAPGLYLVKSAPEIPHLVAKDPQPSPKATWMVLQSPRGESRPDHVEFVLPVVKFVAFVEVTEGVVRKARPVICLLLVPLSARHSALDQDLSAACTGAKVELLVAMKPKMWSPWSPGLQS